MINRKIMTAWIVMLALSAFRIPAFAGDPGEYNDIYTASPDEDPSAQTADKGVMEQLSATAYYADSGIVLDGDLSEWNKESPLNITDASQIIRDPATWLGEEDLSAVYYVMWDEENLYLATETKEATPFGSLGNISHDLEDNIKLYLSTDPTADPSRESFSTNDFLLYLMMDSKNWYTAFDRTMLAREDLARFTTKGMEDNSQNLEGYQHVLSLTEDGYTLEIAIPWADFSNDYIPQYTPADGDTVNFDICITDNDYPYPNTEASVQMAWCGDSSINKNPSHWGRLTFRNKP